MSSALVESDSHCIVNRIQYREFCSCYAMAIQVDFSQSFKGSISVTAPCIKIQLMLNEHLERDLQIRHKSLSHEIVPSWRNLVTECQRLSNCFALFFSWPPFRQRFLFCNRKPGYKSSMKLHMYTHG